MGESAGLDELILRGGVYYNIPGDSPETAIRAAMTAVRLPKGIDRKALTEAVLEREALMSTAIGAGIAIPHPRSPCFTKPEDARVAVFFLKSPVDWGGPDNLAVTTVFALFSAEAKRHLSTLAEISRLAGSPEFHAFLAKRPSTEELADYLRKPVATR